MIYRPPEQAAGDRGGAANREIVAGLLAMAFLLAGLVWLTGDVWCPKLPSMCLPSPGQASEATPAATLATPDEAMSGGIVVGGPRLTPGTALPGSGAAGAAPTPPAFPAIDSFPAPTEALFPTPDWNSSGVITPMDTFNPFATATGSPFEFGGGAANPTAVPLPTYDFGETSTATATPTGDYSDDDFPIPPSYPSPTTAAYP